MAHMRVVIRVRPPLAFDCVDSHDGMPDTESDVAQTIGAIRKQGPWHAVLGPESGQQQLFIQCGMPELIQNAMRGYNGCVFAFGASGTDGGRDQNGLDGLIPQVSDQLFRLSNQAEADSGMSVSFKISATYVEVYDDRVYDLWPPQQQDPQVQGQECHYSRHPRKCAPLPLRDGSKSGAHLVHMRSTEELMQWIAEGSALRVTTATGIHDHSSRSHALLTLFVEKQWSDKPKSTIMCQRGSILLVDLAGSEATDAAHGGLADRAGCSVNVGLLVLGRVLDALRLSSATETQRIPFRDSALTRLLGPALASNCSTAMLVCLSPVPVIDENDSAELWYAKRARCIKQAPSAAKEVVLDLPRDPMEGDVDDPDPRVRRRVIRISTKHFGEVSARAAGISSDPLLLYVHVRRCCHSSKSCRISEFGSHSHDSRLQGSGPKNSSLQWNWLVNAMCGFHESSVSEWPPDSFYHVCVDCPGYGATFGDRQTIRSYPVEFLSDVVASLGKEVALMLIGSSQGACAVLNAVLENPNLSHFCAVCHPVGHNVSRYSSIHTPTLLAFDTEDSGHPVSVGRRMRDNLPDASYFEFASSESPDWLEQNFHRAIRKLMGSHSKPANVNGGNVALPRLDTLDGGYRAWSRARKNEEKEEEEEEEEPGHCELRRWNVEMMNNGVISYVSDDNGERRFTRPEGTIVQQRQQSAHGDPDDGDLAQRVPVTEAALRIQKQQQQIEAESSALAAMNRAICECCVGALYSPHRLETCGHYLCRACAIKARYHQRCGVESCGIGIGGSASSTLSFKGKGKGKGKTIVADAALHVHLEERVAAADPDLPWPIEAYEQAKREAIDIKSAILHSSAVIVLEFGNESNPTSSRSGTGAICSMKSFVRLVKIPGRVPMSIRSVTFDINPGTPNRGITVTEPDGSVFHLTRGMKRGFPCNMLIRFGSDLPSIDLIYKTQCRAAKYSRRIVLVLSSAAPRGSRRRREGRGDVNVDVRDGNDAWIVV